MIVRGIAMWARVIEGFPNELSKKYQVDICHLDDDTISSLEEQGITIKSDEDKGSFVTAKAIRAPRVMDAAKRSWCPGSLIGNGSVVKISAKPYEWTFKGKSGVGLGLNQLMVVKHVEYVDDELEAEEVSFDDEDDVEV